MRALDLFCGAGGLSSGFSRAGFDVLGVDKLPWVPELYALNGLGTGVVANLHKQTINGGFEVVIGGPPCRPWSTVNLQRRGAKHGSFRLLGRFVTHVIRNRPQAFLMENVPPAARDIERFRPRLESAGYSVRTEQVRYSDYGAATARRRLVMVGSRTFDAQEFFRQLAKYERPASTVRAAIGFLERTDYGGFPDHVYPFFQTIERYMPLYETGKYGWSKLSWDKPAPSFGNVTKTYTLHPSSWDIGPARVISVREALLLMGFPSSYEFPGGLGIGARYQLVADSVSPVFSFAAARALGGLL